MNYIWLPLWSCNKLIIIFAKKPFFVFSYTSTLTLVMNFVITLLGNCSYDSIYHPIRVIYNLDLKHEVKKVLKSYSHSKINQNHF